jgi:nucleoid-associated protein YgaU
MTEATPHSHETADAPRPSWRPVAGAIVLIAILGLGGVFVYERVIPPSTSPEQDAGTAKKSVVTAGVMTASTSMMQESAPPPAASQAAPPSATASQAVPPLPAETPAPIPAAKGPGVDVVRVDHDGGLVVAGSAAPGTTVTITSGKTTLGEAKADSNGQWVFLPDAPLAPGVHELHLTTQATVTAPAGSSTVLLTVPSATMAQAPATPGFPALVNAAPGLAGTGVVGTGIPGSQVPLASVGPTGPLVVLSQGGAAPRLLQPVPGSHPGPVGLDVVQYDEHGRIQFSGHARPGHSVRLYVDNAPIGDATADAAGQWQLSPNADLKPGLHQLRADELAGNGKVIARSQVPFARAEVAHLLAAGQAVVQPGDSLWLIARHSYGHGVQYTAIFKENTDQIRDPDLIFPGQTFHMPTMDEAAHAPAMEPRPMAHHKKS